MVKRKLLKRWDTNYLNALNADNQKVAKWNLH